MVKNEGSLATDIFNDLKKENIRLKIALAASVAVNIALAIAVRNK